MRNSSTGYSSQSNSSSDDSERKKSRVLLELIFEDNEINMGETKMLESLIGKKIKIWSAFNDSNGGTRGQYKGTTGVLKAVDSEFILLDNDIYLSRKFIFRIELA